MEREQIIKDIQSGKTALGIEFGSTRIKAVLVGSDNAPIASGAHDWENQYENHIWTYSLKAIWKGLQDCYQKMAEDVKTQYGIRLETIGAVGFSAMMHGYMAFDQYGTLLTPFRTWRNTITAEASKKLTEVFQYNIPQRWSIAHLYQAILTEPLPAKAGRFISLLKQPKVAYVPRYLSPFLSYPISKLSDLLFSCKS